MKITLVADLHIGMPGRLDDILWALQAAIDYNTRNDIRHMCILGDLLHNREQLCVKDLCRLSRILGEAQEHGQEVIAFPGNHDMYMKNSWDITSLEPLNRHLRHINGACKLEIGGHGIWVLPFIHREGDYMDEFKRISSLAGDNDYLFTHIGTKNATLNSCFLLKSWSVVNLDDNPFRSIFTGHFHNYQKVGDNVYYIGSPLPFKFDEGDTDHGFVVLDLENNSHELVSVWSCGDGAPPKFLTLDGDNLEIDKDVVGGNIIRVAMFKDYTNSEMATMREHLEDLGACRVQFVNWVSKEGKENFELARGEAAAASDLFAKFIDADKSGTEGLSNKILLKLNEKITLEGDERYHEVEGA